MASLLRRHGPARVQTRPCSQENLLNLLRITADKEFCIDIRYVNMVIELFYRLKAFLNCWNKLNQFGIESFIVVICVTQLPVECLYFFLPNDQIKRVCRYSATDFVLFFFHRFRVSKSSNLPLLINNTIYRHPRFISISSILPNIICYQFNEIKRHSYKLWILW
jgi:hypothetical protein